MSLLSSDWIRALCIKPTFILTQNGTSFYTRQTLEFINNVNLKSGCVSTDRFFTHHRELTEAESNKWEPLIFSMQEFTDKRFIPAIEEGQPPIEEKIIPYGLADHGYVIQLGEYITQMLPKGKDAKPVDPLNIKKEDFVIHTITDSFVLQPNEHAMGHSIEYFCSPDSTVGVPIPEQRYLDAGLIVTVEGLGAHCKGRLSISMFNPSPRPIRIYVRQGIAAVVFFDTSVTTMKPPT